MERTQHLQLTPHYNFSPSLLILFSTETQNVLQYYIILCYLIPFNMKIYLYNNHMNVNSFMINILQNRQFVSIY